MKANTNHSLMLLGGIGVDSKPKFWLWNCTLCDLVIVVVLLLIGCLWCTRSKIIAAEKECVTSSLSLAFKTPPLWDVERERIWSICLSFICRGYIPLQLFVSYSPMSTIYWILWLCHTVEWDSHKPQECLKKRLQDNFKKKESVRRLHMVFTCF